METCTTQQGCVGGHSNAPQVKPGCQETDMRSHIESKIAFAAIVGVVAGLGACSGGSSSDSVTVEGNVAVAYVKRPVSALGNPTDSVVTGQGGDLYIREKSSPSASETNVTGAYTQGRGDVSDPEVSYDGTKLL